MPTVGNTTAPTFGNNNSNQYNETAGAAPFTMPASGQLTTLHAYISGYGAAVNTKLCVWDQFGNLLAATPQFSVAQGNGTAGGNSWVSHALSTPLLVTKNTQIFIGWWTDPAGGVSWSTYNGGGGWQSKSNAASAGSISGAVQPSGYFQGGIGAYADYTPSGIFYGDSGGVAHGIVAVYYGDALGVAHQAAGVWVGLAGGGVKQVF